MSDRADKLLIFATAAAVIIGGGVAAWALWPRDEGAARVRRAQREVRADRRRRKAERAAHKAAGRDRLAARENAARARRGLPPRELRGDLGNVKYKLAGARVDGRQVRAQVPNLDSIPASLSNYRVLDSVRAVPFSAFTEMGPLRFYSQSEAQRTGKLAAAIRESKEVNPLIVVEDAKGPYILEGGHRFDALRLLNAKAFPAIVALDLDDLPDGSKIA